MDMLKSKITGDAYDKPAQTKDGAMTTQDSADAHTTDGTSAESTFGKGLNMGEKEAGIPQNKKVNDAAEKEFNKRF